MIYDIMNVNDSGCFAPSKRISVFDPNRFFKLFSAKICQKFKPKSATFLSCYCSHLKDSNNKFKNNCLCRHAIICGNDVGI